MKTIKVFLPLFFLSVFLLGETVYAQKNSEQIEVGYVRTGRIDAEGFHLNKEATIQIREQLQGITKDYIQK